MNLNNYEIEAIGKNVTLKILDETQRIDGNPLKDDAIEKKGRYIGEVTSVGMNCPKDVKEGDLVLAENWGKYDAKDNVFITHYDNLLGKAKLKNEL